MEKDIGTSTPLQKRVEDDNVKLLQPNTDRKSDDIKSTTDITKPQIIQDYQDDYCMPGGCFCLDHGY